MFRTLPNFLSSAECDDLMHLSHDTLQQNSTCVVFNPDGKRRQCLLPNDSILRQRLVQRLEKETFLRGRTFGDAYVMTSDVGCKQQDFHLDYDKKSEEGGKKLSLSVLVALMDNTRLELKNATITLAACDAFIFESTVVHAGAAYDEFNMRLFFYLPRTGVRNPSNATYLEKDNFE